MAFNELITTSIACYEPSGRIGAATGVIFAVVCVAGAAAGYVYQGCLRASSNLNMHWLLLFGFGIILFIAGIFAVRRGHCRSHFWAVSLGILVALFFLVSSFLADYEMGLRKVALASPEVSLEDMRNELGFGKWLGLRTEAGWKVAGIKLTGWAVVLVWIVEAAWLFAFSIAGAISAVTMNPYCERCGQWTTKLESILPGGALQAAENHLARGDLDGVLALRHVVGNAIEPASSHSLVLNVGLCPRCDQTAFLTVRARTAWADRSSGQNEKYRTLLANAILSSQQRAEFTNRLTSKNTR